MSKLSLFYTVNPTQTCLFLLLILLVIFIVVYIICYFRVNNINNLYYYTWVMFEDEPQDPSLDLMLDNRNMVTSRVRFISRFTYYCYYFLGYLVHC
ncbi:hypothetical protein AQUCO_02800004v1 [Aquilegia coerulea]|uniref:Uncharacterized protein n=1 Tax=Aquilegia coerulea TaxID=218851 RepID=A0A2G5D3G9_AQUCA|nr:hypothetical protein AQUCO_02800004v1 [Aquilegia coerulea]